MAIKRTNTAWTWIQTTDTQAYRCGENGVTVCLWIYWHAIPTFGGDWAMIYSTCEPFKSGVHVQIAASVNPVATLMLHSTSWPVLGYDYLYPNANMSNGQWYWLCISNNSSIVGNGRYRLNTTIVTGLPNQYQERVRTDIGATRTPIIMGFDAVSRPCRATLYDLRIYSRVLTKTEEDIIYYGRGKGAPVPDVGWIPGYGQVGVDTDTIGIMDPVNNSVIWTTSAAGTFTYEEGLPLRRRV